MNFTPQSDTSTIVIFYNGVCGYPLTGTASWDLRVQRDTTTVIEYSDLVFTGTSGDAEVMNFSTISIDAPATTSTVAYNIDVQRTAGSGSCLWNNGYTSGVVSKSTITLLEIEL